ncbi:hypothetical protein Dimus_001909 [Dionaea muscipula]
MEDANPPVNPQTRKRRRTGTVQEEKLPKKPKPEKVKRRSWLKTPLSPPRISSPEPIGAKDKQKAVADDVADDVADTSVKAAVVKVADVATKIVHTTETLVTMTDKDLDVLVDKIVADVGVMDVAGIDVPKQDDVALNELHTPDHAQIPDTTDPGFVRSVRVVGEGRTDFNARSPSNKRVHEFLMRPYINITPEETNQITREQLHQFIADQRGCRYVGTLEYADAKFFATFIGEEAQLESMVDMSCPYASCPYVAYEIA